MSTTVPNLPPAPVRGSPEETYIEVADAFAGALQPWGQAVQAVGQEAEAAAAAAEADALSAAGSAAAASASQIAAAQSAGAAVWVAGSYAENAVVFSPSSGLVYRRKAPGGASPTDPASDPANWRLAIIAAPLYIPETGTTVTAVVNTEHGLQNASQVNVVLPNPGTLSLGDTIWIAVENGRSDNYLSLTGSAKFNGETQADNELLLDDPYARLSLRWAGATYGWSS